MSFPTPPPEDNPFAPPPEGAVAPPPPAGTAYGTPAPAPGHGTLPPPPPPPAYGSPPPPSLPPTAGSQPPPPMGYGAMPSAYGAPPSGYGVPGGYGSYAPQTSSRATAVMVLGILSIPLLCLCGSGVVTAIIALALTPGAKREIAASGGTIRGASQVQWGMILSVVALVLAVIGLVTSLATGGNRTF